MTQQLATSKLDITLTCRKNTEYVYLIEKHDIMDYYISKGLCENLLFYMILSALEEIICPSRNSLQDRVIVWPRFQLSNTYKRDKYVLFPPFNPNGHNFPILLEKSATFNMDYLDDTLCNNK